MVKPKEKEELLVQGLILAVSAFTIALSSSLVATVPPLGEFLAKVGIAVVGYSSINLTRVLIKVIQDEKRISRIDRLFGDLIKFSEEPDELPILIGTNVEACISTAYRGTIDIVKLSKLRAYCKLIKEPRGQKYPPIIICTGRSQEYVEFISQILGLVDDDLKVPFIIEMGAALYYPSSRKMKSLLYEEEEIFIGEIRLLLKRELSNVQFESKSFIVTVNPIQPETADIQRETIDDLSNRIRQLLSIRGLDDQVKIINGKTDVDIIPKRIDKLLALRDVVKDYIRDKKLDEKKDIESIIYIAESDGDIEITNFVKQAYCSESESTYDLKENVKRRFGKNNILDKKDIDVFLTVLKKACGVEVV